MSSPAGPQLSPMLRAWYRWKALRLPWRKRFLVGLDLQGNTYWIFRDPLAPPSSTSTPTANSAAETTSRRWRRIVKYPPSTHHSAVSVPPAWHQWLRYQRELPPSIAEQAAEVSRRQRIQTLAAEADARWEAKPRYIEPTTARPAEVDDAPVRAAAGGEEEQGKNETQTAKPPTATTTTTTTTKEEAKKDEDPWKRASGPSESWQPSAWTPASASRKR